MISVEQTIAETLKGRSRSFCTRIQYGKVPPHGGIDVAGTLVYFCDTVKLLAVTLDPTLSMDRHVSEVVCECSTAAQPTVADAGCRQDARSQHCHIKVGLCQRTAELHDVRQPRQTAGGTKFTCQSHISGTTFSQCYRTTSTAPLVANSMQIAYKLAVIT